LSGRSPNGPQRSFPFEGEAEIIAHRGFSARAPENTLVAIDAAVVAGADAVEFDLHVSADGVPMLFHDDRLERTTNGRGAVRDRTLAELRTFDAGAWFAPEFAGEPVPTFAEALARVDRRLGRVYPEIKGHASDEELDRMVESVVEQEFVERTVFISMNWNALTHVRSRSNGAGIGFIVEKASRAQDALERAADDTLAIVDFDANILLADPSLADEAARRGVELAVWTVNDVAVAARLHAMGVRRITTNEVARLVAWKGTL